MVWLTETGLRCKVLRGAGNGHSIDLTLGSIDYLLSNTNAFTYNSPFLQYLAQSFSNLQQTGTLCPFHLLGTSLPLSGPGSNSVTVVASLFYFRTIVSSFSGTAASATEPWRSSSSVALKISHLPTPFFSSLAITLTSPLCTLSQILSFGNFFISGAMNRNGHTTGAYSVTILSRTAYMLSFRASVGGSRVVAKSWRSASSVRGKVPLGQNRLLSFVLTIPVGGATATAVFCYNEGALTQIERTNVPASGAASVTLHGRSFDGITSRTQKISFQATFFEAVIWRSTSSIRGKSTETKTSGLQVTIRITSAGKRIGNFSGFPFSFNRGSASSILASNNPTTGSTFVSVQGIAFTRDAMTHRLQFHASVSMLSDWVSESSIQAKTGAAGPGGLQLVAVSVLRQPRSSTRVLSFNLLGVVRPSVTNFPPTGALSSTVTASDFGTLPRSLRGSSGATAFPALLWFSGSSIRLRPTQLGRPGHRMPCIMSFLLAAKSPIAVATLSRTLSFNTIFITAIFK